MADLKRFIKGVAELAKEELKDVDVEALKAKAVEIGSAAGSIAKEGVKEAKEKTKAASEKIANSKAAATISAKKDELTTSLVEQKKEIEEKGFSQKSYEVTVKMLTKACQAPAVRVDREKFLRQTFGNSKYIDQIIEKGPQYVYTPDALRKKAEDIIKKSTRQTSVASFVAGLPSSVPGAVIAGTMDITQFFGFSLNLAQKIAYIFGEDDLFTLDSVAEGELIDSEGVALPEDAQSRMIGYLGAMMGVSGAGCIILETSKNAGKAIGKQVASKALTKTAWYPVVKKVGSLLGYKITKKTVESVLTKAVPVVGGVVSGGITYITFKPMGGKLADVFVKLLKGEYDIEMELNKAFEDSLKAQEDLEKGIVDIDFREVSDEEYKTAANEAESEEETFTEEFTDNI